jgi:hypothetical protein
MRRQRGRWRVGRSGLRASAGSYGSEREAQGWREEPWRQSLRWCQPESARVREGCHRRPERNRDGSVRTPKLGFGNGERRRAERPRGNPGFFAGLARSARCVPWRPDLSTKRPPRVRGGRVNSLIEASGPCSIRGHRRRGSGRSTKHGVMYSGTLMIRLPTSPPARRPPGSRGTASRPCGSRRSRRARWSHGEQDETPALAIMAVARRSSR